jgi:hypothetical protein
LYNYYVLIKYVCGEKNMRWKGDYLGRERGPVAGRRGKKRVMGGEYDQSTLYACTKMS